VVKIEIRDLYFEIQVPNKKYKSPPPLARFATSEISLGRGHGSETGLRFGLYVIEMWFY